MDDVDRLAQDDAMLGKELDLLDRKKAMLKEQRRILLEWYQRTLKAATQEIDRAYEQWRRDMLP
jgi:hypothetical protein